MFSLTLTLRRLTVLMIVSLLFIRAILLAVLVVLNRSWPFFLRGFSETFELLLTFRKDSLDCNDYRGISLADVPDKLLVHFILLQIFSHLPKFQRPEQPDLTSHKSTTYRLVTPRVLS